MHYSFHPHNSSTFLPFHAKKMKVQKGKLLIWAQQWENWDSKSDLSWSRFTLKLLLKSYFRSPGQLLNYPLSHPSKFDLEGTTFQPVWLPEKRWFCENAYAYTWTNKFSHSSENLLKCLTKVQRVLQAHSRCSKKVCLVGICSRVRLVGESFRGATRLWTSRSRAACGRRVTHGEKVTPERQGESSLGPLTCCTKFLVVEQCGYSQESCCLAHHLGGVTWSLIGSTLWMNLWIFSVK